MLEFLRRDDDCTTYPTDLVRNMILKRRDWMVKGFCLSGDKFLALSCRWQIGEKPVGEVARTQSEVGGLVSFAIRRRRWRIVGGDSGMSGGGQAHSAVD